MSPELKYNTEQLIEVVKDLTAERDLLFDQVGTLKKQNAEYIEALRELVTQAERLSLWDKTGSAYYNAKKLLK